MQCPMWDRSAKRYDDLEGEDASTKKKDPPSRPAFGATTRFWDVVGSFDRNETSTVEAAFVDQGHLEDEAILSCQHS